MSREHVGEEFEGDREQELHEGDDDKYGKGDETQQVLRGAPEVG